jgi:hypothetical protein
MMRTSHSYRVMPLYQGPEESSEFLDIIDFEVKCLS